jgi:hypothetical protein
MKRRRPRLDLTGAATREFDAARTLRALPKEVSDVEIAEALTEYILSQRLACWETEKFYLWVQHKGEGEFPLRWDWNRRNCYGITTPDENRAREWCLAALLMGYAVVDTWSEFGGGSAHSIADECEGRGLKVIATSKQGWLAKEELMRILDRAVVREQRRIEGGNRDQSNT